MTVDDVVICYFKVLQPGRIPDKQHVKQVFEQVRNLKEKGWTYQQICNRIIKIDQSGSKLNDTLSSYLSNETPPYNRNNNLLEDKFYYHHRLHIVPEPNEIRISTEGEVTKKSHPFYLEIVEFFTIKDLTNYFHNKMGLKDSIKFRENKNTLSYLANNYSLDLLLFSIDQAYNFLKDNNYRMYSNVRKILNHIADGEDVLNQVKGISKGKVIPYYKAYLQKRGDGSD